MSATEQVCYLLKLMTVSAWTLKKLLAETNGNNYYRFILKIISTSFPSPLHTSASLRDFQIVTFSRYMSILVGLYII